MHFSIATPACMRNTMLISNGDHDMTTIRQAQRAIDKAGIPLEIVRGEGYHYFIFDAPASNLYVTVSVYVPYTNTYTAAEWAIQAALAYADILDRIEGY